jgi:hypothetical protein
MSTPAEKPRATARRAMGLWQSCQQELAGFEMAAKKRQMHRQQEDAFLFACGVTRNDILLAGITDLSVERTEDVLPLELFLKAFGSDSVKEVWPVFWEREVKKAIARASNFPIARIRDYRWPNSPNAGIHFCSILGLRVRFAEFIKRQSEEFASKRGAEGAMQRSINLIAESRLAGKELSQRLNGVLEKLTTDEQKTLRLVEIHSVAKLFLEQVSTLTEIQLNVLKSVTIEEQAAEIKSHSMDKAQSDKWKAAIVDAKAPATTRPRRIPHKENKTRTTARPYKE